MGGGGGAVTYFEVVRKVWVQRSREEWQMHSVATKVTARGFTVGLLFCHPLVNLNVASF